MSELHNPGNIRPVSSSEKFEIPFDVVQLPSKGLVYPDGSPLRGKTQLEVHYLTAIHEDILTSPNLIKSGKMVPTLLNSVIKDNIDPGELTLGDRNTILIWLRSTGYGADYPLELVCSDCGAKYENEFDLSELDIKELEIEPDSNGLFDFELPTTKKKIKFKLMNSAEEQKIMDLVSDKKRKLKTKVDPSSTLRMVEIIKEIDGKDDQDYIREFVRHMPAMDTRAFRKYYQEVEPGIIMEQVATCSQCGYSEEVAVPIAPNFFWPDI